MPFAMPGDWTNLCVLNHVCDILGPYNCVNSVCKVWKKCVKTYRYIRIDYNKSLHLTFLYVSPIHVERMDLRDMREEILEVPVFKSLKKFYSNDDCVDEYIGNILGSEGLEELDLENCCGINDDLFLELRKLLCLRVLSVCGSSHVSGKNLGVGFECLEELNLRGCYVMDDVMGTICRLGKIRRLNLGKTGVTDEGIGMLRGMKFLRSLDVSDCAIGDRGMEYVCSMVWLEELYVGCCDCISDKGFKSLRGMKLRSLDVSNGYIGNGGIAAVSQIVDLKGLRLDGCRFVTADKLIFLLERLTGLTDLSIRYMVITAGIAHALSKMDMMRTLNLGGCEMFSNVCRYVGMMKGLEVLNLDNVYVEDKNVHLGDSLKELSLQGCVCVTDEYLRRVSMLKGLCRLNITNCRSITSEGFLSLRLSPNLRKLSVSSHYTASCTKNIRELIKSVYPRVLEVDDGISVY